MIDRLFIQHYYWQYVLCWAIVSWSVAILLHLDDFYELRMSMYIYIFQICPAILVYYELSWISYYFIVIFQQLCMFLDHKQGTVKYTQYSYYPFELLPTSICSGSRTTTVSVRQERGYEKVCSRDFSCNIKKIYTN